MPSTLLPKNLVRLLADPAAAKKDPLASEATPPFYTPLEKQLAEVLKIPPIPGGSRFARQESDISFQMELLLKDIPIRQKFVFGNENLPCVMRGMKGQHIALTKLENGSYLVENLAGKGQLSMKCATPSVKQIDSGTPLIMYPGTEVTIGRTDKLKFTLPAFQHPTPDDKTVDYIPAKVTSESQAEGRPLTSARQKTVAWVKTLFGL